MTSVLAAAAVLVGVLGATDAEDDLAVVRRAVAVKSVQAAPPAPEAPPKAAAPTRKNEKTPRWLRVRVVEKRSQKARVSVNVPLALVRALGDECPVSWCRWRPGKRGGGDVENLRLSEVLAALESGQSLVEVDDEDATVRIWVD